MWNSIDWTSLTLTEGIDLFRYFLDSSYQLALFCYFISWVFAILYRLHGIYK
jgi:hypothetical protein